MAAELNTLSPAEGARQNSKRVGRGIGSGKGKTCGRGHKGQKSRSGVAIKGFEGGQMPIHRRLPKRGFKNISKTEFQLVNLSDLESAISAKKIKAGKLNAQSLVDAGIVRSAEAPVKLLGKGNIKSKVEIEVSKASKTAVKEIEAAGGKVTILSSKSDSSKESVETQKKTAKPSQN